MLKPFPLLSPASTKVIQDYRTAHKLSQKQLEQQLSFPLGSLGQIEGRLTGPSLLQLRTLTRVLGQDLTLE